MPLSEIRWIEADGDYTIVHIRGNRRITERRSVREWEGLLPKEEFIRVHRGPPARSVSAWVEIDSPGAGD